MGRPKASERVKKIALAFVRLVTNQMPSTLDSSVSVYSQFGRISLHRAMVLCLPHLTRRGQDTENREGISEMELNKLIRAQGHDMVRRRDSLFAGESCRKEWFDLSWIQPSRDLSNSECIKIQMGLAQLHNEFPETRKCSFDTVLAVLLRAIQAKKSPNQSQAPILPLSIPSPSSWDHPVLNNETLSPFPQQISMHTISTPSLANPCILPSASPSSLDLVAAHLRGLLAPQSDAAKLSLRYGLGGQSSSPHSILDCSNRSSSAPAVGALPILAINSLQGKHLHHQLLLAHCLNSTAPRRPDLYSALSPASAAALAAAAVASAAPPKPLLVAATQAAAAAAACAANPALFNEWLATAGLATGLSAKFAM